MANQLYERLLAIRDALIEDVQAAWPEVEKIHKALPETVPDEVPFGWVVRVGPLEQGSGSTRNQQSFRATYSIGGRFAKPNGASEEDERIRLAGLLTDRLTATAHHGDFAYLGRIERMLTEEAGPDDQFVEVDAVFALEFDIDRTDAV